MFWQVEEDTPDISTLGACLRELYFGKYRGFPWYYRVVCQAYAYVTAVCMLALVVIFVGRCILRVF